MTCRAFLLCAVVSLWLFATASAHTPSQTFATPTADFAWANGYTLVLVDADSLEELNQARAFILAAGGDVAITLPPHALLGWISPEVGEKIVGKQGIRSLHRTPLRSIPRRFNDRDTQFAIKVFNGIVSGQSVRQMKAEFQSARQRGDDRQPVRDCSAPQPQINRSDYIRNLQLLGAEKSLATLESQATLSPQFLGGSDVMDGTVALAVFLLESNGTRDLNTYNWTAADQQSVIDQIVNAANWWADQSRAFNLARPLRFTFKFFTADNPACQIGYEPILYEARVANLFVDAAMNNIGLTEGDVFSKVAAYNQSLRAEMGSDWAYSAFVCYNPPPTNTSFRDGRASWAYLGGPHTLLLYRSFGWDFFRLFIHETGHIFHACDEYFAPGFQTCSCTCVPAVRPQAVNANCQDVACNANSIPCMMRVNELSLCSFTVAQIGWTNEVPQQVPNAPTGLVAAAASPTQVNLVWQDNSTSEDGFQIERRGGASAEFAPLSVVPANISRFTDAAALPNTVYAYRVYAFNLTGRSANSPDTQIVTPSVSTSLAVATSDFPDATVGVPYSRTLLATGGTSPYAWSHDSGTLPPGLTLSQAGTLAGTPTAAGTFNFVLRVIDATTSSATRALTIIIKPVAPLTITTAQLPRGSVGTTYSQQLGATGGQTPYSWFLHAGSLPEGLQLSPSGVISGIPERAGSGTFTLRLADASGAAVTASLSLAINPPALVLNVETASLPDGVVGQDYVQNLQAAGGTQPYRWELTAGRLPDGLTMNDAGRIEGRPTTQGDFTFDLRITDQSGQTANKQLSIEIDPAPQFTILTPANLPVAAVGLPYRVELQATAGTAPYKWIRKNKPKFGILPDGITLASEGLLSGTPTAQGVFNFTIRAKDATGKLAARPFVIEVGPPPPPLSIRTETLANATQGVNYRFQLEAGGGAPPYRWTLESGTLPVGMTLSETGLISGRSNLLGATAFVVRLTDALGTLTTRPFILNIIAPPPPLAIQTVSLPETSAERPYVQQLQATGGVQPYTWAVASGSLGAGLQLSADGRISGTPLTAGNNVFTVAVTDSAQQTVSRTLAIIVRPADRLAPFGVLETPDQGTTFTLTGSGSGWALDNVGITRIEVLVDGVKVADAVYGGARPDIEALWATFPNARTSGYTFTFDATRLANGSHTLAVRLLDLAENATIIGQRTFSTQNRVLSVTSTNLARGTKGQPYSHQFTAADGRPPYAWTIASGNVPQGLSLNASGLLSGTPSVFGEFTFTVRVTDSVSATATAPITLSINPDIPPLRIFSAGDLTPGSTGAEYLHQLLFTGGVAPRVWSMNSGALPPGLSLNPTAGQISGSPTDVGTFTFTVRLTDATTTFVVSEPLHIVVTPGPLVILSPNSLPNATTGANYSYTLLRSGGDPPYTWALNSGELPPGLTLNATTGVISGKPTVDGQYNFTLELKDTQPLSTISNTMTITVQLGALTITSAGDLTNGKRNTPYAFQLVGNGGRQPYMWTLASGALPTGLTLNAETGVISGTPTALGTFTFTVKLTDAVPAEVTSATLRITIIP